MLKKVLGGCLLLVVVGVVLVGGFVSFLVVGADQGWDWSWEDPLTAVSWSDGYNGSYTLTAEPTVALVSEPVAIQATGFAPNQLVGVRAAAVNHDGALWQAAAVFQADAAGNIDLTQTAPQSGSYEGVAPMGLFWSMRPENSEGNTTFLADGDQYEVQLTLEADGETLAETTVQRLKMAEEVVREEVSEAGVVGVLYRPAEAVDTPAVLVIGGSEGGMPESRAALFASHGYTALAVGYFGVEGQPAFLSEIPLEYFDSALGWLAAHPAVDSERIALYGHSRGSEAAFLTAVRHPELAAIIAVVPSSMVWTGLDFSNMSENRGQVPSAWTRDGVPLPANGNAMTVELVRAMIGQPAVMRETFTNSMADPIAGSIIPVEQIQAPILLISSTDDALWPSTSFAEQIVSRLESSDFGFDVQHVAIEGAGHLVKPAWEPPLNLLGEPPTVSVLGGSRAGNGQATAILWQTQTTFLEAHLGQ